MTYAAQGSRGFAQAAIYFGAVALVVCETLRRIMYGIRPFDWVMLIVEVLVLIFIAAEIVPSLRHKARARKRQRVLFSLLTEGQAILNQAPSPFVQDSVHAWGVSVDAWSAKVTKVLADYSQHALASFNHQPQVGMPFHHIATGAWPHYGKLTARVENLRNIIEKPEIYY